MASMTVKRFRSSGYNYNFDKQTGLFVRWGETLHDDPLWSPFGPEIADIEISTGDCSAGKNGRGCDWCYKSNSAQKGQHMSLGAFEKVLAAMPDTLTQVALGITDADANPDFIAILEYCRSQGVIPNYTTSGYGITDEIATKTAELCGAVAVSVYPHNWDLAWNTVKRFIGLDMKQVNVHLLYHANNKGFVRSVLNAASLVEGLNAVVLLGLKPAGRGTSYKPMGQDDFSELVDFARSVGVRIGFDSCSAPKFERWATDNGHQELLTYSEPCESSLFSVYVDVNGNVWPCSFGEQHQSLEPVSLDGFWQSEQFVKFRERLLASERKCPLYDLGDS